MKRIKYITRKRLESWEPCPHYTPERINELAAGRKSIAVKSVFNLPIPDEDKLWLLCHKGILPDETFRSLARRFALRVIDLWDAPEVVRQYLETGDESLRAAAWSAAWAAAWAAAGAWQLEQIRAELEALDGR